MKSDNYQLGSGDSVEDAVYLDVINKEVNAFFDYFRSNHSIYRKAYWFVFGSSLSDMDKRYANLKKRYALEINNLASVIQNLSTRVNEFPPSVSVTMDDFTSDDKTLAVEKHLKYLIKDGIDRNVFSKALEQCLFGFSFIKLNIDYKSEMTLDREVRFDNVEDVCNIGFDIIAKSPNKGRFMFEIFHVPVYELKDKYPDKAELIEANKTVNFYNGYKDSFINDKSDINTEMVTGVVFYERVTKREKLIELDDGNLIWESEYKTVLKDAEALGVLQHTPTIKRAVTRERVSIVETVAIRNVQLSKSVCRFHEFPYVYFDGNSHLLLKDEIETKNYKMLKLSHEERFYLSQGNNFTEFTESGLINMIRPYIKTAMDSQRLVNVVIQEFYNELDGRPAQSYTYPIDGDNLVIAQHLKDIEIPRWVPRKTLDAQGNRIGDIQPLPRMPIDSSVMQSLPVAKSLLSESTGDFSQEVSKNLPAQVSGAAVRELLTLDKAQAKPYINNYILGLNELMRHTVDIAKSVLQDENRMVGVNEYGDKEVIPINDENAIPINEQMNFNVCVSADLNEDINNQKDFESIMNLAKVNPDFNQFIASDGFPLIFELSNVKHSSIWIKKYKDYLEAKSKQPPPVTPIDLQEKSLELKEKDITLKHQENQAALELEAYKTGAEVTKDLASLDISKREQLLRAEEIDAERERTRAELYIKHLNKRD